MMKDGGMQKDINDYMASTGTQYLLSNQRGVYLVTTNPQNLLVQNGVLLDTNAAHNNSYIFVMDGEGAIYSAAKAVVHHHSAFLAGGPVASAGHWQVTAGIVQWVCNNSGHYQPPIDYCKQILSELKRRHINVTGIAQNWTGTDSKKLAKAAKKENITFKRIGPKGVIESRF
jgi:hypothetical protein